MERRAITFRGRVQGVGFRATAAALARDVPVSGWVRNEPDGSVRLEVQGLPADVRRFLQLLDQRLGRLVTSQDVVVLAVEPEETGFRVLR